MILILRYYIQPKRQILHNISGCTVPWLDVPSVDNPGHLQPLVAIFFSHMLSVQQLRRRIDEVPDHHSEKKEKLIGQLACTGFFPIRGYGSKNTDCLDIRLIMMTVQALEKPSQKIHGLGLLHLQQAPQGKTPGQVTLAHLVLLLTSSWNNRLIPSPITKRRSRAEGLRARVLISTGV